MKRLRKVKTWKPSYFLSSIRAQYPKMRLAILFSTVKWVRAILSLILIPIVSTYLRFLSFLIGRGRTTTGMVLACLWCYVIGHMQLPSINMQEPSLRASSELFHSPAMRRRRGDFKVGTSYLHSLSLSLLLFPLHTGDFKACKIIKERRQSKICIRPYH